MSQYPSPYAPPPGYPYYGYGYSPAEQALAPARRASNLMIILGIVGILFGLCAGVFSRITPEQLPPEQREKFIQNRNEIENQLHVSFSRMLMGSAIVVGVPAFLLTLFGSLIRSGSRPWLMASIILTGLILVLIGLPIVMDLRDAVRSQGAAANACFFIVGFALFAWQMASLIQAYRASGTLLADSQQTQSQYWQYIQQQQQAYAQWYAQQVPPPPAGQPPVVQPPPPPGSDAPQ